MMRNTILYVLFGALIISAAIADDIDTIESEDPVIPKAASEIPGLTPLAPHISLPDSILADGNDCFGFQPGLAVLMFGQSALETLHPNQRNCSMGYRLAVGYGSTNRLVRILGPLPAGGGAPRRIHHLLGVFS